jgi:competence protein ComEA
MHKTWIALAAVVALLAGPARSGATATADASAPSASSASAARAKAPTPKISATPKKNLVNLNAASRQQLKGLPRGSDEEAARIIAGRPYNSKAFLVTNNVITPARFEEIRNRVVAGEATKPAARKK